jgi:hypothetical protein
MAKKAPAVVRSIHTNTPDEIVQYFQDRCGKGRGVMVLFVRPDGRVRIMRDELLEDSTGRGVVGHFGRHHGPDHIKAKLAQFQANNQKYLSAE